MTATPTSIALSDIVVSPNSPRFETRPVELLRDARGVYGIGVSEAHDYEAHAWAHGIDEPTRDDRRPASLVLRPDKLDCVKPREAVLQKIVGGFRRGPFMRSTEEGLRQFVHHEALNCARLPWPPEHRSDPCRWWSTNQKEQASNRAVYHGLRLLSLHVINDLIGKAIEEAADLDAIRAARRFTFRYRERIYRAGARSHRALQLTETFPVLALNIYSDCLISQPDWDMTLQAAAAEARSKAADLIERGARLRKVAAIMNIPMALRAIKPGTAHLPSAVISCRPALLQFMPQSSFRARIWLRAVGWADCKVGGEFADWVARNVAQIPGNLDAVGARLSDIADWVRAGTWNNQPSGCELVVRPFTRQMSLQTVMKLSADWHEAVADNMSGPDAELPAPWFPAGRSGDYEISPIESLASLYREGKAMHHCVGTYGDAVRHGSLCVYSIRRNGEQVATLALVRNARGVHIDQIRGPCNALAPDEVIAAVRRWLRAQKPLLLSSQSIFQKKHSRDFTDEHRACR